MTIFDSSTIQRLASDLAHNITREWPRLHHELPADLATPERLSAVLMPGIAAFIGRLLTLVPEQAEQLPEVISRYFSDPATGEALLRFVTDSTASPEDLLDLLVKAGVKPNAALFSYFDQPLALLVTAANAAFTASSPAEGSAVSRPFPSLPDTIYVPEFVIEDITGFVNELAGQGLDRIEIGQVVAADGQTVLFSWEPVLMSAAPPDEFPESAGPEESLGETAGEMPLGETGEEPATSGALPPAPTPAGVDLRLDAALPERVTVGRSFDLAIAIKRLHSEPLAPEDLTRRESTAFAVVWPDNAPYISLRVQISAPDCEIHGGDSRQFRLLVGQDSPTIYFQLTPQRVGALSVIITVYQEMDWIGSTRLRTEAGPGELRGEMAITVSSQPLPGSEINDVTLWKALTDGYNLDELQELCFELGIDFESIAGDNKSAKARELVQYARRHHRTADLVERIMAGRPHLLAPV